MAAPTPVSALVHSSTLVTAGVYLLIFFLPSLNSKIIIFGGILCFVTITLSGISAVLEKDFKKIVAFSTLSQMSLLFFMLFSFKKSFCIFHLFSHAFFKSLLFVGVGAILHARFSSQDSRDFLKTPGRKFSIVGIRLSAVNLIGLFFSQDFYLKTFLFYGV